MSELDDAIAARHKGKHNVRVLFFDVENAPNDVYTWGLWKQNVSIAQIVEPGRVFGFGAKWLGEKEVVFRSDHADGHEGMVKAAWDLFTEADIIVTYNGIGFDIPHMQREFLLAGLLPPKPYKQIDLLRVVRKQFRFASNKMDFISQQLGLGRKTSHQGFDLWVKCMKGDERAWALMARYCKQDVKLTEKLYHHLLPWLTTVPHIGQMDGQSHSCWACGGTRLKRDGTAYAFVTSYRLYQCLGCGAWVRGSTKLQDATTTRQQKVN
ncbi:MAG: ribonuclease H-like domain-containing protein [Arthrobacter sp.]